MRTVYASLVTLLLLGANGALACTTWIVGSDANQYGSALLHKNRDWGEGKEQTVTMEIVRPKKGYKYLKIGHYMLLNEAGLALADNAIAATSDPTFPERMSNRRVMAELAETCATTQEATARIKQIADGQFSRAVTLSVCDPSGGAFYELSSVHLGYRETTSSFDLRTNDWILPEMKPFSALSAKAKKASARRLKMTREALSRAISAPERMSVADSLRIARLRQEQYPDQSPFRKSTVSSATFLPDQEFPAELSVAFVCLGPTRMTAALPVPMALEEMPTEVVNGDLGRLAYRIKEQFGAEHPYLDDFIAMENRWHDEYFAARGEARMLLRQGRREDAVKRLNQLFLQQERELLARLAAIVKETP